MTFELGADTKKQLHKATIRSSLPSIEVSGAVALPAFHHAVLQHDASHEDSSPLTHAASNRFFSDLRTPKSGRASNHSRASKASRASKLEIRASGQIVEGSGSDSDFEVADDQRTTKPEPMQSQSSVVVNKLQNQTTPHFLGGDKLDEEHVMAMSSKFAREHLSSIGCRLLLVAKEYRQDIMQSFHPWKDYEPGLTVPCRRLYYDVDRDTWDSEPILVQMGKEPFDRGALRECFKMKQIRGTELKELIQNAGSDTDDNGVPLNANWSRTHYNTERVCWVAKQYMDKSHWDLHKQDAAMQMIAKRYAEHFDRERLARLNAPGVPKKWREATHSVDFLMSHVVEFDKCIPVPGSSPVHTDFARTFSVEAFVFGMFDKYSTNSGAVLSDRRTPQAFSHFTFEHSKRSLICVDVQGVDDLYTDPAVHAPADFLWCDANLGLRGMALFFWSHRCNDACRCLGLPQVSTYAECPSHRKIAVIQPNATSTRSDFHGKHGVNVSGLAARAYSTKPSDESGSKAHWSSGTRLVIERLLSWPHPAQWMDVPRVTNPKGMTLRLPEALMEPCIHMELCSMYASGRLSAATGDAGESCPEGAVFHLQLAARGGLICAMLALARLTSDFSHEDFLPSIMSTSFELSLRLLELAAEHGSADAAASCAELLHSGVYDDADYTRACSLYQRYADLELGVAEDTAFSKLQSTECAVPEGGLPADDELVGVTRPSAYHSKFGWDNHGLTPHVALAKAAELHEQGGYGLKRSRAKASLLYSRAAEAAGEAMAAKAMMKYEEKASELEKDGEESGVEEEDDVEKEASAQGSAAGGATANQSPLVSISISSAVEKDLKSLADHLGGKDLDSVIRHLLRVCPKPILKTGQLLQGESQQMSKHSVSFSPTVSMFAGPAGLEEDLLFDTSQIQDTKEVPMKPPMPSLSAGACRPQMAAQVVVEEEEEASCDFDGDPFAMMGCATTSQESAVAKEPPRVIEEAAEGDWGGDPFDMLGCGANAASAVPVVEEEEACEGDFGDDPFALLGA